MNELDKRVAALSPAKQALLRKRLNEKADSGASAVIQRGAPPGPVGIAIIGMVGRFPGARNLDEFWRNLHDGVESISFFRDEELEAAESRAFNALLDAASRTRDPAYVKARGILSDAELFDAAFFAINPKEAEVMDPQQRVFLESAWEALEHAGYDPEEFKGAIGVFAGMSNNSYYLANLSAEHDLIELAGPLQTVTGNEKDYLATRVSYKLNLQGPSVAVQTACSTSLVAVGQAVQSLLSYQCDMALAGGVSITLPQKRGYLHKEGGIRSPDGHCRPFDANARGTVFSNGVGVVVLKRLDEALKDGDKIYAVIKGVGVNNDGAARASFAAPSVDGQSKAIALAHALAGVDPRTITYVEAHGTGTELGDPIEVAALTQAFRTTTAAKGFCALGSVKSNIGHLDAAAGVTGLIKTALALKHGQIPPSLNYEAPNPMIDFGGSPFFVNTKLIEWETSGGPRRAGVSSFGVGGTNAHAVLEEAPASEPSDAARPLQLLLLSARTHSALEAASKNLATHLRNHPDLNLADAAYTLQVGRRAFSHRRALVCSDHAQAVELLGSGDPKKVFTATQERRDTPVVFLFPGQGAQYVHMGRGLYQVEPMFRAEVDRCAALLQPHLGLDLRDVLFPKETDVAAAEAQLGETRITQPALFVISYALAKLWMAWGIKPKAMLGHSVGEYVAACLAGVFTLEDALQLIAARARLVQAQPGGAMLAVRLLQAELSPLLDARLSLAAINSPSLCVVAGPFDAIEALEKTLDDRRVAGRRLPTSHAFHSAMMDPVIDPFTALLRTVKLNPPQIPFVSNLTARWVTDAEATSPEYWAGHLRQTVRFADGVAELLKEPRCVLLEVGPGQTLNTLVRQHPARTQQQEVLSSLTSAKDQMAEASGLLTTLGRLWLAGAPVNWAGFHANERRHRVALPTYPFERKRYWVEPLKTGEPVSAAPVPAGAPPSVARPESAAEPAGVAKPAEPGNAETRPQRILAALTEILHRASGLDVASLGPAVTFLEMGFDSLFLTQASQAFQRKFAVKITFRQLLEELPTLNDLTAYLDQHLPADAFSAPPSSPIHEASTPAAPPANAGSAEAPKPEPKAFGPYRPIDKDPSAVLTDIQQSYLASFIERYTRRTAESKRMAQAHRARLADPRAVAGFRLQWKEMVYPIVSARSTGARIWDVDGNEYVDLTMGFGVHFFGHSPPFVTEAIQEQLKLGMEIGPQSRLAGRVAELFCELTAMERATFCNTGSEAVMAALRVARTVTGRTKVVMFAGSYHGIFDEVLVRPNSVGDQLRSAPAAPGVPATAVENVLVLDYGNPRTLEIIRERAHELAAVLVEPVQSRHLDLQPWEFLRELRRITEQADVPLIFDEMITGFRIHPGGIQALHGLKADLATYGKVIGGGMPMGVLAGKARYMDALDGGAWQYGDASVPDVGMTFFAGTFIRHPLAVAAMWAVLNHLKQCGPELQAQLNQKAARLIAGLNDELARMRVPLRVPSFGSIFTLSFPQQPRFASMLSFHMRARGVNVSDGRQCFLSTAHSDADIDFILRAFQEVLEELRVGGFLPQLPEEHPVGLAPAPVATPVAAEPAAAPSPAWAATPHPGSAKTVPLTPSQQEIWLATQLGEEASSAYIESQTLKLRGPLNRAALQRALDSVVSRHDALRTTFSADGRHQQIAATLALEIPLLDLSPLAPDAGAARAAEILDAETRTPFDLVNGPLLRVKLLKLEDTLHWLVLADHHIICDGWSMGVILYELGVLYSAQCQETGATLPEPMSYADYSSWQIQQQGSLGQIAIEEYWRQKFLGSIPVLDLPTDRPRPVSRSNLGAVEKLALDDALYADLKQVSSKQQCTLLTTLLSGFGAWLYRLSGQTDLVIGMPAAGQLLVGDRVLVGHCVNLLPMRHRLTPEQPFTELLAATKTAILDDLDRQNYTFGSLLQKLNIRRDSSRVPLVSVTFNVDRAVNQLSFDGLTVEKEPNPVHGSIFDLSFNIVQTESRLLVECNYNTDLFDAGTIRRWLGHYQTLLAGIVAQPAQSVDRLPMLSAVEKRKVLVEWNATASESPADKCIHEIFEEQVEKTPDAVAIQFGDRQWTYREINTRSNQLARCLEQRGIAPDVLAGLCLERSPEMIIGLLGVLKAGGAYVPLDPALPRERLSFLLDDTQAPLVLTQRSLMAALPIEESRALCLDEFDWSAGSENDPAGKATPGNLAYVIYTSGSTGLPKGVMIEHRALTNYTSGAADYYGITPDDRVLQFASINFDASLEEIFCTLTRGATLCLRTEEMIASMETFAAKCREWELSVVSLPTSFWHELVIQLEAKIVELPESIRLVVIGGERASPERVAQWKKITRTALINSYGPTEATVVATAWTAAGEIDPRNVPIGRPLSSVEAYILDRNLQPVPIGVTGELHIGGAGLARGYLKRPDLTAEKFIPHPFGAAPNARLYRTGDLARHLPDGNIEFQGRVDSQVKIRGFRIELGEIETALQKHPLVRHAAIVARTETNAAHPLVGYLVSRSDGRANIGELREFLSDLLPAYMIPSAFVWLNAFPMTPTGKLDQRALPEPAIEAEPARTYVPPRNPAQGQLIEIWEEVLNRRPIGIRDDFFELGGHSLLVARLLTIVQDRLGVRLPFGPFFTEATIERMAALMKDRQLLQAAHQSWVALNENGSKDPFFFLHGDFYGGGFFCRTLARHAGIDRPFYAMHPAGLHGDAIPESIEEMAALKLRELRSIKPEGPYLLGGYCNGALVAFEMARQIEAQGGKVPIVLLLLGDGRNVRLRHLQRASGVISTLVFEDAVARQRRFLRWREHFKFLRGVRIHYAKAAADLIKQPPREQARRIVRKTQRIFRRLSGKGPSANSPSTNSLNGQSPPSELSSPTSIAYGNAVGGYVPRHFGGRLVLLWPQDEPTEPPGPACGWMEICDDVRLVPVPGDYASCVERHANLGIIGEQIGRLLAEIEGHSASQPGTTR